MRAVQLGKLVALSIKFLQNSENVLGLLFHLSKLLYLVGFKILFFGDLLGRAPKRREEKSDPRDSPNAQQQSMVRELNKLLNPNIIQLKV